MKLPAFLQNVFLSGFEREGLITAIIDDSREVEYKKFRSNSHIFSNPLIRIRLAFKDPVMREQFKVVGHFGSKELRLKVEPSSQEPNELEFTSRLLRGRNVFEITYQNQSWPLVVYHKSIVRDWVEGLARAVILIVGLNTFIIQGSYIPSASMMNTLIEGDYIWVNKAAYYFHKPQRGDVVVFNFPLDPTRDFIKRLIGLPGDKIEIRDKRLILNGQLINEDFSLNSCPSLTRNPYHYPIEIPSSQFFQIRPEQVLGENQYVIAWDQNLKFDKDSYFSINMLAGKGATLELKTDAQGQGPYRHPLQILAMPGESVQSVLGNSIKIGDQAYIVNTFKIFQIPFVLPKADRWLPGDDVPEFTVPEHQYFVMGDNRDNSQDSRWWGTVPFANFKGKAFFLYFPFDRMKMIRSTFGTPVSTGTAPVK